MGKKELTIGDVMFGNGIKTIKEEDTLLGLLGRLFKEIFSFVKLVLKKMGEGVGILNTQFQDYKEKSAVVLDEKQKKAEEDKLKKKFIDQGIEVY